MPFSQRQDISAPAVAARLREALEVFSTSPGAILFRGPDRWQALEPGPLGWVLIIGSDGLPTWEDPANITFGG